MSSASGMDEICNPVVVTFFVLVGLIIAAVALFFAMNFGNTLSIPGVITLLILSLMAIASLWYLLSEAKTEAKGNQVAYKKEKDRRERAERQLRERHEKEEKTRNKNEKEKERLRKLWFFQRWFE